MEYRENNTRYKYYYRWETGGIKEYNYAVDGLLQHILSHKIVESKNAILQVMLQYYESSIVFVLKYIDRLKHFKNYHWKNR